MENLSKLLEIKEVCLKVKRFNSNNEESTCDSVFDRCNSQKAFIFMKK